MKLNQIKPQPGSTKNRKRVARGIGSGKGKTAGHGGKGQKGRSGVAINGFEGGQMPLYMRLPKRGFVSRNRKTFAHLNLGNLQAAIDEGRVDAKTTITEEALVKAGILRRAKDGVRLLGRGTLKSKVSLKIHGATELAKAAVEKAGGSVELIIHTSAKQVADQAKRAAKLAAKK
jgi:large subunit ribosomal protein L15